MVKGVIPFLFLIFIVGGCFSPPEFPVNPQIEFVKLEFVETPDLSEQDSLNLYINFKDGDGDLGISPTTIDDPFHEINFFLTGSSTPVPTSALYTNLPPFVNPPANSTGKLETIRSKNIPYNCYQFIYDSVFVNEPDKSIFDATYNIHDTLTANGFPNVYILLDTFYYEVNPTHYNIEVDFLVKNNAGQFVEFDWRKEFCSTFDGRFPVLSSKTGPIEGTLKYSMTSTGFKFLFSIKTLKLRIKIRDRMLHESNNGNYIETPEFTLNDIRKGG